MFLLLLSRSWRWRPGFDPSAPVCVCSREEQKNEKKSAQRLDAFELPQPPRDLCCRAPAADLQKNGPNPCSVIPVRFFSSSDFMILF